MTGKKRSDALSPEELQALNERTSDRRPGEPPAIFGGFDLDDADVPKLVDLPPPPELGVRRDGPRPLNLRHGAPKVYCESCGHVDSHADGCPRAEAAVMLEELDAEEEAARAARVNAPEPIIPLVRRIGASLLRRFARAVDPGES